MSLAAKLLSASGGVDKLYVDDVFSAYTYTGNGATQTITNGIDLAGKGGLVWSKNRTGEPFGVLGNHVLYDSVRGLDVGGSGVVRVKELCTNNTNGSGSTSGGSTLVDYISTFNANGYQIVTDQNSSTGQRWLNSANHNYASWTFRKAPKFFDVVTYTGNGVAGRQIPHALGVAPGMIFLKKTSDTGNWWVYHKEMNATTPENYYMFLEQTAAKATGGNTPWHNTPPTSTQFSLGEGGVNSSGTEYVAYLFAHDSSADGIVQCGSFTTDGSGNATVNLGWEPQFVLTKTSNAAGNWDIADSMRGFNVSNAQRLRANESTAEGTDSNPRVISTGFAFVGGATETRIYLAIRRPNKPPTTGTQVYNAIARTGTGAGNVSVTGVGFPPDLAFYKQRNGTALRVWNDRLRGNAYLLPTGTGAETQSDVYGFGKFLMDGAQLGADTTNDSGNAVAATYINHFFKRAPGVFDICCYTGTGVAKTEAHGLGVVPELMIVKARSVGTHWIVYTAPTGNQQALVLASTAALQPASIAEWNNTTPTSSVFTVGTGSAVNTFGATFVAYLFATKAGISKVFSITGNGTSQTIDCGFTTGARFVMIKATSTTGDWLVGDSTRGLVAGNDPRLSLNTTAAEVTSEDWLDPHSSGFIVNQVAGSNANVNGVSYLVLAFA